MKKNITANSLFEMVSVSQPKVANGSVFFVETQMREKENDYHARVKSVDIETKTVKNWGDDAQSNYAIALNDAKTQLSFISNGHETKKPQIRLQHLSGGSSRWLTNEPEGVSAYLWSKNEKSIYFVTKEIVKNEEEKNENKAELLKPTVITKLSYQNDGSGILPSELKFILKKVDLETGEKDVIVALDHGFQLAYISNDESYALLNFSNTSFNELEYGKSSAYKLDFATKKLDKLNTPEGTFGVVGVSPDETYALLSGNDFSYQFVTQNIIYSYHFETAQLQPLTKGILGEPFDLFVADFQQNVTGCDIVFLNHETFILPVTEQGKLVWYQVNLNGNYHKVIDQRLHLTGSDKVTDIQFAVTFSTLTTISAIGLANIATGEVNLVYNPNDKFEQAHEIFEPESKIIKGYNDWDIQTWYFKPNTINDKYPFILYIHGGPQVAYGDTFFHEMQSLVSKGYAVLMVNPRGGNGYGQEFVASILGDYGNHDYDDLMIAVDTYLAMDSKIDASKLFVTGGSYGGFMTNWIVTHTNRFRAAVTQRSISNWISFYGVSDIGPFFVPYQLLNDLSNMERLWQLSPLAHVSHAETPLLILHGQEDYRCPLEQAQQLYISLRRKGVETKLMIFPKSSHGLSRNGIPNLRLERLNAISNWFDHYQ